MEEVAFDLFDERRMGIFGMVILHLSFSWYGKPSAADLAPNRTESVKKSSFSVPPHTG